MRKDQEGGCGEAAGREEGKARQSRGDGGQKGERAGEEIVG